ncbi:hypothetical protein GTY69_32445 [Streptomyces sp. SID8364]|nr:hypothetical protein [Streptomyces sp. SID8364]
MTAPALRVRLLLPGPAGAARHAVRAAHNMRAAQPGPVVLQEARERALRAVDDLIAAGGAAPGA